MCGISQISSNRQPPRITVLHHPPTPFPTLISPPSPPPLSLLYPPLPTLPPSPSPPPLFPLPSAPSPVLPPPFLLPALAQAALPVCQLVVSVPPPRDEATAYHTTFPPLSPRSASLSPHVAPDDPLYPCLLHAALRTPPDWVSARVSE
ncbi:unnamed protein product [Closterium sp. NIES-54]